MTIRVFLLDDHEIVRRGLRELLAATDDIQVIGESGSAKEAARRIPSLRPDVAIFDARLPDGSGIDACREVRSVDPTIKGLVLTSYDDEHALTTAVLAGASGFLLKDVRSNGLVDAIRRIAAGENLLDTAQARRLVETWRVHGDADPPPAGADAAGATHPRAHRRRADEPADRGGDVLAEKTVKNYVTSVLAKLGMERRTQAAVFAATHEGGIERGRRP